ncbi:MAG: DUF2147 domain-containing protein [Bacteroidales bacterium]|nr:DUF2147 domain-containing protein [Candidatus Colimorpha onthohippi]
MRRNVLCCWLSVIMLMVALPSVCGQTSADQIVGRFCMLSPLSDDTAIVKISRYSDGTYRGRLVWLSQPNNPDGTIRTDSKNKDKKLRNRPYTDVDIFWNLRYKGTEWVEGVLYNPFDGKRFSVKFSLSKNGRDLTARYYKGVPALGIDAVWKRVN